MGKSRARKDYNNIFFLDKRTNETKSKFDIISRDLLYIPRANNPDKSLSRAAKSLVSNYHDMISRSDERVIFVTHEFISGITQVGNRQNNRIHEELSEIFHINYRKSARVGGKKFYYGFTIELTENTGRILENPKAFYTESSNDESSSLDENVHSTRQKCPLERTEMSTSLYLEEPKKNLNRSTESGKNFLGDKKSGKSNFEENFLIDFHPLSEEDCTELQIKCKRDYNLNAMNQILLDMANRESRESKSAAPSFKNKKVFMSYFAKCLYYEKRDAAKISNENFKIKNNMTEEDKKAKEIYKYLDKIESSLEVSPENNFKKKLACVLAEEKAYELLTAYKSLFVENNAATIYLTREVELTSLQHETVLNQVRATHPKDEVVMLEFRTTKKKPKLTQETQKVTMQNGNIDDVILDKFGATKGADVIANCSIKQLLNGSVQVQNKASENFDEADKHLLRTCIKQVYGDDIAIVTAKEKFYSTDAIELWKQFKNFVHGYYKSKKNGEIVISAWFEKLRATQNTADNKLILTGEAFIVQYVDNTYGELLEEAAKQLKINIELIVEQGYSKPILYKAGIGKFQRMSEERLNELMSAPFVMQ